MVERRYHAAENVASGQCNDATYLLNKAAGRYYRLDDVGSEVWALLCRSPGLNAREIVQELSVVYDMPPQDIADDVSALIDTLTTYGVIASDSTMGRA